MTRFDAIELAVHRAIRGEVPPCVRAITGQLHDAVLELSVFAYPTDFDWGLFWETIQGELDQVLPADIAEAPRCSFTVLDAHAFARDSTQLLFVDNPWAHGDAASSE
ncbi:MAG: hypothetical protein H6717_34040 [Polyangiaceae bacterium]|nr:hypothetical protein [Polyangiaceae bacterium]